MSAILFKDRRGSGAEILLKGAPIGTRSIATPNLGIGDLRKLTVYNEMTKRAQKGQVALYDDRVPHDLRSRIIEMRKRIENMPDGAPGGRGFHKDRNSLANEILSNEELPAKLQRSLLQMVLDNAPITSLSSDPYESAPEYPGDGTVYPGKSARVGGTQFDKLLRKLRR